MTLVTELSEILSVSLESFLSGSTETSDFKEVNMKKTACFHTHRHISPEYRWDTVLCISFLFDKKPSGIICIPPSNGELKPFDGTIQTKKRLGYPNRFFIVSSKHKKTPLRIWTVFGARDGTWTHTSKTHAPQTCLSAYSSTLAYFLTCLISQLLYYSTADIYIHQ